jgi:NAD+ synthase
VLKNGPMTDRIKIALAQLNPTVGDLSGNARLVREARARAAAAGADLVLLSELFLAGYPPEDLVLKPRFVEGARRIALELAAETKDGGAGVLLGLPWTEEGKLYNAVVYLDGGSLCGRRFKYELPNYGVFDEIRVFKPGPLPDPIPIRGINFGVPICEDIWFGTACHNLRQQGAEILLVPNGSPYEIDKLGVRMEHTKARVWENNLPIVYLNQVGGQDELVFDGASFVLNANDKLAVQMPSFEESFVVTEWTKEGGRWRCADDLIAAAPSRLEAIYRAMMLGLRDYVRKNRFPGVIIGLSGGIDSALTAAIAADALGPDKVRAFMLPSRFTSRDSLDDAAACAHALGVKLGEIGIEPAVGVFNDMLKEQFSGRNADTTEENIQSRIRGVTLMALSNKFGDMVVTTGNKSEMSVGYATLYGDMCGGFNPLKDLYKTEVFEAARWRNLNHPRGALAPAGEVIPQNIITRPPSAELRADQKDEDTLPPYIVLDDILECLVEREMALADIVARGHDAATVKRVEQLLYTAEYKRRQAPPGVKLTRRNFGRDRRYPITNGFRDAP